ncbi:MAG: RsfA family transcriptional regulator [Bacillaceae bacterium]
MPIVRQDAWTDEDDSLLAEVVLTYIRNGGTQLAAFKEVGSRLNRTSSACGFRWNSYVRKQYRHMIEEAKKDRKTGTHTLKKEKKKEVVVAHSHDVIDVVIAFLKSLKGEGSTSYDIVSLLKENAQLKEQVVQLQTRLHVLEAEYKTMFDFIDTKRNMLSLEDEKKELLLRERNIYMEK